MGSSLRAALITVIAGVLLPASAYAQAREEAERPPPNPGAAALDVVILRPLGLVAMALGTVAFVPAAVLTAPNGLDGINTALKSFVTEPAKSVFQRRLGDF